MKLRIKFLCSLAFALSLNSCGWLFGESEPKMAVTVDPADVAADVADLVERDQSGAKVVEPDLKAIEGLTMVKGYPVARKVPDKEGYVYNPYTKSVVDVRGLKQYQLVRDPLDLDPRHAFRTP